jgi:hypothetical protein
LARLKEVAVNKIVHLIFMRLRDIAHSMHISTWMNWKNKHRVKVEYDQHVHSAGTPTPIVNKRRGRSSQSFFVFLAGDNNRGDGMVREPTVNELRSVRAAAFSTEVFRACYYKHLCFLLSKKVNRPDCCSQIPRKPRSSVCHVYDTLRLACSNR